MGIADDFMKAFLKQHPEAGNGELNFEELKSLIE
ncbi:hypothetical protein AAKU52_002298 [Pedobacter sp. CG_S7]